MRQRIRDSTKKYQDRKCEPRIIFMDNRNETDTFAKNESLNILVTHKTIGLRESDFHSTLKPKSANECNM